MSDVLPDRANPYQRHLVSADDGHEMLAMTWRDGGVCAPHDHGDAGGRVHVVSGGLVGRRFAFDGRGLSVVRETRVEAPAILEVEPGVMHDMAASPGKAAEGVRSDVPHDRDARTVQPARVRLVPRESLLGRWGMSMRCCWRARTIRRWRR